VLVEPSSRAACATSAASPKSGWALRRDARIGCGRRSGALGDVGKREPSAGTRRAVRPCCPSERLSRPGGRVAVTSMRRRTRGVSAAHRGSARRVPVRGEGWGGEIRVQEGAHPLVELERHVRRPVVAHRGGEGPCSRRGRRRGRCGWRRPSPQRRDKAMNIVHVGSARGLVRQLGLSGGRGGASVRRRGWP
jgi:hypothetical protein